MVESKNEHCENTVQQITDMYSENCGIECNECQICVHLYSCTCPDYILQHTICKHVNLVARFKQQSDLPMAEDMLHTASLEEITIRNPQAIMLTWNL